MCMYYEIAKALDFDFDNKTSKKKLLSIHFYHHHCSISLFLSLPVKGLILI